MQIRSGILKCFLKKKMRQIVKDPTLDLIMIGSFQLIFPHLGARERGHSGDQAAAETSFACGSFTQNLRRDSCLERVRQWT